MKISNHNLGFKVLLGIFVLNAAITAIHFSMMFAGVIPTRNSLDLVAKIAIPDIFVAAIPSFFAAWAIWRLKKWGLWLALVVFGAYFHGQIELLVMAFQGKLGSSMAYVSVYFILFCSFYAFYLWRRRGSFT